MSFRSYGRDPHADVSEILKDVHETGMSTGWDGPVHRRDALAAILARYDVTCMDIERGTWSRNLVPGALGGDPSGQWLWLEDRLQLPITEAFADWLCAHP